MSDSLPMPEPTPGPYTARIDPRDVFGEFPILVTSPDGQVIAELSQSQNDKANAHLLAASWEMREALKAIVKLGENDADCNHCGEYLDSRDIALKALAKTEVKP